MHTDLSGPASPHQPDDAVADTAGDGQHAQPGQQQTKEQHQVTHHGNQCVPTSFNLTQETLILPGRRASDGLSDEGDVDGAVVDTVPESLALCPEAVELRLTFRQRV